MNRRSFLRRTLAAAVLGKVPVEFGAAQVLPAATKQMGLGFVISQELIEDSVYAAGLRDRIVSKYLTDMNAWYLYGPPPELEALSGEIQFFQTIKPLKDGD